MKSKLEIALDLADQGFSVFPLAVNSKTQPTVKVWPENATTDPDKITQWWSGSGANRNIGIACLDNVVAIDVDVKDGKLGKESLEQLIKEGLPQTLTQRTTTGGLHLIYKHPGGEHIKSITNWGCDPKAIPTAPSKGIYPGIDIRGNGGFIVAAGSTIGDKSYTIVRQTAIVSLNKELIMALPRKGESTAKSTEVFGFGNTSSLISTEVSPYSELPDTIPKGGRDDFIFRSACSWRERGYTRDHAEVLMRELHSRCEQGDDPFTLDDAFKKIEQAWANYTPADSWTQVVTPEGVVAAPTEQVKNIKDALTRFLFAKKGSRVIDLSRQPQYAVLSLDEFKNAFRNVWVADKQLPTSWLNNKNRQTITDTIFYPKEIRIIERDDETFYNTYTPSNQTLPETPDIEKIKPFINHIRFLLGSEEATHLFLSWCAVTIQKPWVRIPWAPLIITKPRMGKGFIYLVLQKLLGAHNSARIGPDDIGPKANFNEWMSGTTIVCMDEMKTTNKWDSMERLKPMMTENSFMINNKHGKKGQEDVFFNLICFSNHIDAAALDEADGRFWVIYSKCVRQSQSYYDALFIWLVETDGPAHLEVWLKKYDVTDFNYNAPPPMTEAKQVMIDESRSPMEIVVSDAIEDREGPFRADIVDITLVEQYVRDAMDRPVLTAKEVHQLRHIFVSRTEALKQSRFRVCLDSSNKGGKRYRCRSVRDHSKWYGSDQRAVAMEYRKAWYYLQGREFSAELQEVNSESD